MHVFLKSVPIHVVLEHCRQGMPRGMKLNRRFGIGVEAIGY